MCKKSEDTSSVSPMATGVDPNIRAILDAMQKQNEIKLRKLLKETIKEATSGSCQDSLVSNSLNKSLETKNVTVENEEMVLKEFPKELQSNVGNSCEKKKTRKKEDQMMTAKIACDATESKNSADLMSRNLDANTQKKSLENKDDNNPSPSMLDRAHDPKLNNKIKGFVTEKLERFHDNKSITCAECSVSMCTKNASNVTITFRTPQASRKHNQDQTRSSSKVKLRELITANDQKLNYDPEHQLADLQVECSDKDRTTQEFEKHIEDMKEEEELGDIIKLHDEEKYKLIQHWCSVECQTAIKGYIDGKVHKESSETESIKNAAINEVEQEIINKDPQIDDQYKKKKKDEKFQEEQAENTTEIGDHSRYAGDTSLDKESTNDVEIFNTNEGEQNIEKHNVCTVLNIDTVSVTNAQCQALIKTLGETFDDKAQTLHVTDTDTDLSKLVDSSSEVMVLTVETTIY
ncbi:uncharacterized protein LOC126872623 [Bombus huntii]|uniref:uncharacterized protein LOC126872623 n=1 Tax=Bombus huntii TaxID=85661 RepID=UPI0021AA4295|nr:uncharacterized protein LOC126872623 [Bombus huntii]